MDGVGANDIVAREAVLGIDFLRHLVNRAPLDARVSLSLVLGDHDLNGFVSRIACVGVCAGWRADSFQKQEKTRTILPPPPQTFIHSYICLGRLGGTKWRALKYNPSFRGTRSHTARSHTTDRHTANAVVEARP